MIETHEGAKAYEHALDHAVEFFSKAGSLFANGKVKKGSFYEGNETAVSLFQKTWIVDPVVSFKLLLWMRDCRGGAGNRSGFRECLKWLATNDPEWIRVNIGWIPLLGRWDDLRTLFGTTLENESSALWAKAIQDKDVLAAKWADRSDRSLRSPLGVKTEKELRKLLAIIRMNKIVEHKMCTNKWGEITYEHVPSVAMARYTKAFGKHDSERFTLYKEALKKGETTIHAGVLFPHDCVRTSMAGDAAIANAQFEALPNFMPDNVRALVIADTSGSMSSAVSGMVQAVHISQGMALYCSSKLPKDNPFYKKFIGFSDEGKFVDWTKLTFSEAVGNEKIFDGAVGSTNIGRALNSILNMAKMLIIVSDMQFHQSTYERSGKEHNEMSETEVALDQWKQEGYSIPQIVYWNTAGYAGQPATIKHNNVALVSGFSPSILKAIFEAEDLTPKGVMIKTLEKYKIVTP
jgi:hypothetical protein